MSLSKVFCVGDNNKIEYAWEYKECISYGHGFEDYVGNAIKAFLKNYYNLGVTIEMTPRTNDGGKDIIITSPVEIYGLLGFDFYLGDKRNIKIYVECKSSEKQKISYNDLSGNVNRVMYNNVDYYVVVTNTTLVPYTYFQLQNSFDKNGIVFLLSDNYILGQFLSTYYKDISLKKDSSYTIFSHHVYYQIEKEWIDGEFCYSIYLWMRNFGKKDSRFEINLKSDYNWQIKTDNIKDSYFTDINTKSCNINNVISKNESITVRLFVRKVFHVGIDKLMLQLSTTNYETTIDIGGLNVEYDFVTSFIGRQHHRIVNELITSLRKNKPILNIYYLFGQTGVGKSRVIEEVRNQIENQNTIIAYYAYDKENTIIYSKLTKQLKVKFDEKDKNISIKEIISKCQSSFDKYLIILDDIHNAPNIMFDEIKELEGYKSNAPINILLLGRNDYSTGSSDYYSFVEYSKNHYIGYILNPLSNKECKNLIRSIIKDVPEKILLHIFKLSNNTPLFVIQFIEYLLDLKIVYLKNRSTLGIENVETILEHDYMPKKIEEIYAGRLKSIEQLENGKKIKEFLLLLIVWGVTFSKDELLMYLPDSYFLNILINRGFLKYSKNGYITFSHESFLLFLRKYLNDRKKLRYKIVKRFIEEMPDVFSKKSSLIKGQLYAWRCNKKKSREYFSNVIKEFENIDNYSSITVNSEYYDYLYTIYDVIDKTNENIIIQKNILMYRIYLSLHYNTPYNAIKDCIRIEKLISVNETLNNDKKFSLLLTEQKAHALINTGNLKAGESLLYKLLAENILNSDSMDLGTLFDMYDKFTNIYLKYNNYELATKYNKLSFIVAEKCNDLKLLALAEISKGKINSFISYEESFKALTNARNYLIEDKEERIFCHNELSLLVFKVREAFKNNESNDRYMKEARELLRTAINGAFANSIIRCYLLLAAMKFLWRKNRSDLYDALKYISGGIDASVNFGIGVYMWHFYNLKALVFISLKRNKNKINQCFETVFRILKQQNLLFLGDCSFTYENLIALTNIALYLKKTAFETRYYNIMSQISTNNVVNSCDYNCANNECKYVCNKGIGFLKDQYNNLDNNTLIFVNPIYNYEIFDKEVEYYVFFA